MSAGAGGDGRGGLEAARAEILRATLPHVPFDGWTERALAAGIRESGVAGPQARLAFQGGLADLADCYARHADRRMLAALDPEVLGALKLRARIAHIVRLRFAQAEGEKEALRALMSWFAIPGNQGAALACLSRTVDAIWRAAGDAATDFSFYTKRMTLGAVLSATTFYWLDDKSEEHADTWAFLERRLDDVMGIERAKAGFRDFASKLPDPGRILRDVFPRTRPHRH